MYIALLLMGIFWNTFLDMGIPSDILLTNRIELYFFTIRDIF